MSSYVDTLLSYSFNPTAGTINFAGNPIFNPVHIKAITNQTRNTFIYLPGVAGYGGTWDSSGTILTFSFNVSTQASTDILIIQRDDQVDALSNIQALLQGNNVIGDDPVMNRIPGAQVYDPITNDSIKSLIAEVRMMTQVMLNLAREDLDLNAYKRQILDQIGI